MEQIRLGLESDLDIRFYKNPKFDYLQMHSIRIELENGLDVSKYAKIENSWEQMREIREDLLEIDRMNKLASKAYMKELEEKTDFSWYAEKEFGGDIFEDKTSKKQFNRNSLEEIRKGLK